MSSPSCDPDEQRDGPEIDGFGKLKIYVEALAAAATRCRRVLVLIAVASVVFFIACWNSREEAWLNLRIRMIQDCLRLRAYEDHPVAAVQGGDRARRIECEGYLEQIGLLSSYVDESHRRMMLESDLQAYRKIRRDNIVTVHVPFFLTVFDVNDLGIISGITFLLLGIGYWFSVMRERDTLTHAFDDADHVFGNARGGRREVYNILSTSQVLNVPNVLRTRRRLHPAVLWMKKRLSKLLAWPPVAILFFIVANDFKTLSSGTKLGQGTATVTFVVELCLLVLLAIVTVLATYVSLEITRQWDKEFALVTSDTKRDTERSAAGSRATGSVDVHEKPDVPHSGKGSGSEESGGRSAGPPYDVIL